MSRVRDSQRSRVYAWEDAHIPQRDAVFKTVDECATYAAPIWRKERGRVGLAGRATPAIERPHMGQTRGLAYTRSNRITLPRWARSPAVILHEMAHLLTPTDEAHGPRFVGVLIGLAARWLDADATRLMQTADEMGVRYHVRSIGVVPVLGPAAHVERLLRVAGPLTPMDIACELSLAYGVDIRLQQVRGAVLQLHRLGRARYLRGRVVLIGAAVPEPPAPARAPRVSAIAQARALAAEIGASIDHQGGTVYAVWPPVGLTDEPGDDPYEGDHAVCGAAEALFRVQQYAQRLRDLAEGAAA